MPTSTHLGDPKTLERCRPPFAPRLAAGAARRFVRSGGLRQVTGPKPRASILTLELDADNVEEALRLVFVVFPHAKRPPRKSVSIFVILCVHVSRVQRGGLAASLYRSFKVRFCEGKRLLESR